MARNDDNRALTFDNDINELGESIPDAPASERLTLLPPAPPVADFDLIGPGANLLSLAALEAALHTLPFDEDSGDVLVLLDTSLPQAEPANDGIHECDRPTRRYSVPDMPPCMRPTVRP